MAELKTNAMRLLDKAKVQYKTHSYDPGDGKIDGISVAEKLGVPAEIVFKTLVTQGASKDYVVFIIPVSKELDLKAAARAAGEKSVEMIKVSDILAVTGYIRGGCSPLGMKKNYKTILDDSCESLETIIFSAGKIGHQIELIPADLIRIIRAKTAPIVIR